MLTRSTALMFRSIREDARLLRSHILRALMMAGTIWGLFLVYESSRWSGAPGLEFFAFVSFTNLLFITIAGIGYFSSAITEEKEELTLGLLRMAGIGPLTLLLGKAVPRLLTAVLLLALQYPFTLLAITLGGVTIEQVVSAFCSLTAYTIMLGNLALLASVLCRRSRSAAWLTAIIVGTFGFVPLIFREIATSPFQRANWITAGLPLWETLCYASPLMRLQEILTTGYDGSPYGFQVVSNLAAAVVFFGLSWAMFDRFNRDEAPVSASRGLVLRFRKTGWFRSLSAGRCWSNAPAWKDFHFISGGRAMFAGKLIAYTALFGGTWLWKLWYDLTYGYYGRHDYRRDAGEWLMGWMLAVLAVELTAIAGRVFSEEQKWKTLSTLVLIPVPLTKLLYSKLLGASLTTLPAIGLFSLGALLAPDSLVDALGDVFSEPAGWFFLSMTVLFLHLVAYFSLYLKWGALPAAFAVLFLSNACCLMLADGGGSGDGLFAVLGFFAGFGVIVLHGLIAVRISDSASQW